jgi:neutral ceramidase
MNRFGSRSRFIAFVVITSIALFVPRAIAQEGDWSAGLAAVNTTPQMPVRLAGYAARVKPSESVDQDIYATALALKDAQDHRAVLVTLDLCTMPANVGRAMRDRIMEKTKLDSAHVVVSLSHSHSAPVVSLGSSDGTPGANVEYTKWLIDRAAEAAEQALAKLAPAKLSWGWGVASFAMNRRQFTDRGIILGVNPLGSIDRTVQVLRIESADGKLRGVLFGYACHNTTNSSRSLAVSGDYAGYAKAHVRQQFPDAIPLFMMGCGGDANPYPRDGDQGSQPNVKYAPIHGEELGKEVCRVLGTKLQSLRGPLNCAEETAQLPLETPDEAALEKLTKTGDSLIKPMAQQMLDMLKKGHALNKAHAAPVCVWQFGKDLTMVQLPDEVVSGYARDVADAVGPLRVWVAAYCNQVTGYIPTARILREGGYESRGLYDGIGWFAPEVEQTLTNLARDTAVKAGREMPKGASGN